MATFIVALVVGVDHEHLFVHAVTRRNVVLRAVATVSPSILAAAGSTYVSDTCEVRTDPDDSEQLLDPWRRVAPAALIGMAISVAHDVGTRTMQTTQLSDVDIAQTGE